MDDVAGLPKLGLKPEDHRPQQVECQVFRVFLFLIVKVLQDHDLEDIVRIVQELHPEEVEVAFRIAYAFPSNVDPELSGRRYF